MQKITPYLWFDKQAKEAAEYYTSVFPNSKINSVTTLHNTPSGNSDIVVFKLNSQPFMAISAGPYFKFNEAVSFMVSCQDQKEIDYYWAKLSADPNAEQCGWCKDKFGLSWQIVPDAMREIMTKSTEEQRARVTKAFLQMKKFIIKDLEAAYRGE